MKYQIPQRHVVSQIVRWIRRRSRLDRRFTMEIVTAAQHHNNNNNFEIVLAQAIL
jgi:hypothetical protein